MRLLLRIAVVVCLALLGFVAAAAVGAPFAAKDGLAGGATVFMFGLGGLLTGLASGVLLARKLR